MQEFHHVEVYLTNAKKQKMNLEFVTEDDKILVTVLVPNGKIMTTKSEKSFTSYKPAATLFSKLFFDHTKNKFDIVFSEGKFEAKTGSWNLTKLLYSDEDTDDLDILEFKVIKEVAKKPATKKKTATKKTSAKKVSVKKETKPRSARTSIDNADLPDNLTVGVHNKFLEKDGINRLCYTKKSLGLSKKKHKSLAGVPLPDALVEYAKRDPELGKLLKDYFIRQYPVAARVQNAEEYRKNKK